MSDHTILSRASISRSERQFVLSYMPAAFAAGTLIGSILMMSVAMMRLMPECLGFSMYGLGAALAISTVAILFEQNSASRRARPAVVPLYLRAIQRRALLAAAVLGAFTPLLVTVVEAL